MTPVDLEIRIESYGFECEAGPLVNCLDWIELKGWVFGMQEALQRIEAMNIEGTVAHAIAHTALKH